MISVLNTNETDKGALRVIDKQTVRRIYASTELMEGFQDTALSKHITDVAFIEEPSGTSACITVNYEPRNIAVIGGGTFVPVTSVKVAGTNPGNDGWTLPDASQKCQGTSSNAYLGSLGTEDCLSLNDSWCRYTPYDYCRAW